MSAPGTRDNYPSNRSDIRDLDRRLLARVDALLAWLGVTGRRVRNRWVGGPKGGRIDIVLTGGNAGAWGAWSAGKKGRGLIGVIAHVRGLPYGEAIREARSFLGDADPADNRDPEADAQAQRQADAKGRDKRIAQARQFWSEHRSVAGTIAEHYLVNVRGFTAPAGGWPEDIAFHSPSRALILAGRDAQGEVQFVHLVYLTIQGDNVREDGDKKKRTYGPKHGAALRLRAGVVHQNVELVLHAEGGETAIAAWLATGHETHCRFGTLGEQAQLVPGRRNIILADDDPTGWPTETALGRAMPRWRRAGFDFAIAYPWPSRRFDKSDFNDALRDGGMEAVRTAIAAARREPPEAEFARGAAGGPPDDDPPPYDDVALRAAELTAQKLSPATPPFPLPTATPAEVQAAALAAVHAFFMQRGITPPARIVVPAITGSGKTRAINKLLPHVILADKAEREVPGRENTPYRAVIMVPAHRLGRQIKKRLIREFEAVGLTVATIEGRGDPWRPAKPSRPYLCQNLEPVGLAIVVHQDPRSAVCGKPNGRRCAFFEGCDYLAQFAAAREADVLIVAHEFLFEELPKSVLHDVAYVIVEEEFTATGDAISELSIDSFRKASLDAAPALEMGGLDETGSADLHRYSARLVAMCDAEPDGFLADDAMLRHGFTSADARYLRYLHWKRRMDPGMHPGMALAERREAQHRAAVNQQLPKIAALTHMLANGEAARIKLVSEFGRNGTTTRSIILHGRRQPAKWLGGLPILFLNATARLADVQRFFPTTVMVDQPRPRLEHQSVHQFLGAFGKSAMTESKVADLLTRCRAHLAAGKVVLVIVYEQNEAAFRALPQAKPVPEGLPQLRVLHHGDYAGDDDHGDVDLTMHIGGPFAPYREIAQIAAARSGERVPVEKPVRTPCVALMEDGTGVQFERMAYEHPAAQAVHEGIYDAAFIQGGLGRGRGINRSEHTPLDIEIYGNAPLPVPLATLQRWRPSRERKLLADGGTHSNARDLRRFHPDEFDTEDAAAKWRQRHPFDEATIRDLLAGDPRPHAKVTWQPAGQGHKERCSILPIAKVEELQHRAKREFGALTVWKVEPFFRSDDLDKRHITLERLSRSSPVEVPALVGEWQLWTQSTPEAQEHPPDG